MPHARHLLAGQEQCPGPCELVCMAPCDMLCLAFTWGTAVDSHLWHSRFWPLQLHCGPTPTPVWGGPRGALFSSAYGSTSLPGTYFRFSATRGGLVTSGTKGLGVKGWPSHSALVSSQLSNQLGSLRPSAHATRCWECDPNAFHFPWQPNFHACTHRLGHSRLAASCCRPICKLQAIQPCWQAGRRPAICASWEVAHFQAGTIVMQAGRRLCVVTRLSAMPSKPGTWWRLEGIKSRDNMMQDLGFVSTPGPQSRRWRGRRAPRRWGAGAAAAACPARPAAP